ncbi:MAG: hypothetical protein OEZ39_05635 [Gammaproteobacteria bacterium]|nr:hypothetical protein [Gammaproteobacteria bacterium]
MLEIEKKISKYYEIKPYEKYQHCWRTDAGDVNSLFVVTVFKILPDNESCVVLISRNHFDEKLCDAILELVEKSGIDSLSEKQSLVIVEDLNVSGYQFDSLAIINYESFKMFYAVDEELDRKTFGVEPIARCELTGHESADEILALFARTIDSSNWKRDISPRVKMRYKLGSGSTNKYKLYSIVYFKEVLVELVRGDSKNIELYNFMDEYVKINNHNGLFVIHGESKNQIFETDSVYELNRFVMECLTKDLK